MADQVFVTQISAPTRVQINGVDEVDGLATKSTGSIDIGFDIKAALQNGGRNRVLFWISSDGFATYAVQHTQWYKGDTLLAPDGRLHFTIGGLAQNTNYRIRMWTERPGQRGDNYNALDFWTNRFPNVAALVLPTENQTFVTSAPISFDWQFSDPDPGDTQLYYELRWRNIVEGQPPGPWSSLSGGTDTALVVPGNYFQANRFYEWQVRTCDPQGAWGEWSLSRSFYMRGGTSPPIPVQPTADRAIDITQPVIFAWQFRDPDSGDTQAKADLRYRAAGTANWTTKTSVSTTSAPFYNMPANILLANVHYEWQVRTYDVGSGGFTPSDWSNSVYFYSIRTPGELATTTILGDTILQGALGCGHQRVFVYQQGGRVPVGEITPIRQVVWKRQRDDISNCTIDTNGFGFECGELLSRLRSWQHELVVFRDGVRVWEGPITRITYTSTNVEIEAKDVMAYVYRRIMRQGYDDSYNCTQLDTNGNCVGVQLGLNTVVYRAARIIIDALGRGDPNVLPYLTQFDNLGDARTSRIVPDYAKTAWEEVDDLAATAGLDYVTVGRRIMLWDTHYPIGRLPEMRDGDFSDPVIVTEYGMNLSNYYGVTDGSGVWGAATPQNAGVEFDAYYGPIEMLSSSYGDSADDANGASTPAAVDSLRAKYASQAQRNISNRWPTPVVVRVPDNTTIQPDVNLDINHLIPGVWIPLRSTATLREVSQWQKLDSVTVTETAESSETVQVVMSPAPNGGNDDPDADSAASEET